MASFEVWKLDDYRGGLCEKPRILPNQSPDCRNVIARVKDLICKRGGQARLNTGGAIPAAVTGAHAYYKGAGVTRQLLVTAADGKAYQYIPATKTFTEVKSGISATALPQFVTCVNYAVCVDGVTHPWKTEGTTISDLANAPSDAWLAELYAEKLCVVSASDPSTLLLSESFQPEEWPGDYYWKVGDGDGDTIRAVKTYRHQNHLAIFKRRKIFALYGTSMDDMRMPYPVASPGAVGPNAVVENDGDGCMYYVSDDGVCKYDGFSAVNLTREALPATWATVNKAHIHKAACFVHNGILWVALPISPSTVNNFVLCYDPLTGAWWPFSGINASCFVNWDDGTGSGPVFLSGSSSDGYMVKQDFGADDFGAAISAYWWSAPLGLGDTEHRKLLIRALIGNEPYAGVETVVAVTSTAQKEGKTAITLTDVSDPSDPLVKRMAFADGSYAHQFQIKYAHTAADRLMQVRSTEFHFRTQRW